MPLQLPNGKPGCLEPHSFVLAHRYSRYLHVGANLSP
jgi:hypothetical protein